MNMFYFRHAVNLDDKAIDAFKEMIDFIDLNTNNGNLLRQYQLTKLSFLMRSRYCRASASDNVLKLSMIVLTEQIYHKIYIDASSILI